MTVKSDINAADFGPELNSAINELDERASFYRVLRRLKYVRQLETITSARRGLGGSTRIPYVNFWLAVALAQQGDMRRALQTLEEVQGKLSRVQSSSSHTFDLLSQRRGIANAVRGHCSTSG